MFHQQMKSNRKILSKKIITTLILPKCKSKTKGIPNVKGMPAMDAIALLENLDIKVKVIGMGKVKSQSLQAGENIVKYNNNPGLL
jgi:cell division protein FtsI (penicillin-binding protein 3)